MIKNIVKLFAIVPLISFSGNLYMKSPETDIQKKRAFDLPLVKAINIPNPKIKEIKKLLDAGADANTRNPENQDPVFLIAVYYGNPEVIKLLAKYGANTEAKDRAGRDVFKWVEIGHINPGVDKQQLLKTLKSLGVTSTPPSLADLPPLPLNLSFIRAVNTPTPNIKDIKNLLDAGARVNIVNPETQDLLFLTAVYYGNPEVIKLLAAYGADTNAKDSAGRDAFKWVEIGHIHQGVDKQQLLKTLKSLGGTSIPSSVPGMKPLDLSLVKAITTPTPQIEEIKKLLNAGANPNTRNPETQDPVFLIAIYYGNLELVKLLAKYGADPKAKDSYGRDALERVERKYFHTWSKNNFLEIWAFIRSLVGKPL